MTGTEFAGASTLLTVILVAYRVFRTKHVGGELPSIPELVGRLFYWWARMWYCHLVAYDEYLYKFRDERRSFSFDQKVILAQDKGVEAAAG